MSYSGSRAVQLMLSVENKQNIEGSSEFGVGYVFSFIESIQLIKEIFDVAEIVLGFVIRSPDSMTIGVGSYSREGS